MYFNDSIMMKRKPVLVNIKENCAIKNSGSQKLLGATIDRKLTFH